MEIKQHEKESLAAYIHQLRTAAKRCNFTNDVATIQIFIKGLKNAHNLATHIYEKGLQALNDAISEVEKLNNVQQLIATITPPSTVNMMMKNEGKCFQYQEHGHIGRHCPIIRCFECDDYDYIVIDCPCKTPPLGAPAKHHQSKLHKGHHARSSSRHCYEDRYRQSHSRSQLCFHKHCSSSCQDSYRGHSRSQHRDNCHHHMRSSWHSNSTYRSYSHQPPHDTPHRPHHRASAHRSSSYHSTDRSLLHSHPSYKSSQQNSHRSHSHSNRSQSKPHHKKNTRVKIEEPHTDYYSSDNHSSDSGEEMDHLN